MKYIDSFLNKITMYALLLWGLFALAGISIALSLLGVNDLSALHQIVSLLVVVPTAVLVTVLLSKYFNAVYNIGSAGITGLIVYFIFDPGANVDEYMILALAATIAAASKFLIAPARRHLLNPAAAAAVILGLLQVEQAIWWVARAELTIPMLIFGFLILRKLHRFAMFFAFFAASVVSSFLFIYDQNIAFIDLMKNSLTVWPTLFLGAVMLTEPITTPPKRIIQVLYGVVVGVLFGSSIKIGSVYMTPELALVAANVFFYAAFLQRRVVLVLRERKLIADSQYGFSFTVKRPLLHRPGEYIEITAPLKKMDSRGNRRSFSLASSPNEKDVKIGIKVPENPSAFKQYMMQMKKGDELYVNHLQGDFVLPKGAGKYIFIAGGIGITPFRSMIADVMLTKDAAKDIVLLYQVNEADQIAYDEIFSVAHKAKSINVKIVYVNSSKNVPKNWQGEQGYIDKAMLERVAPDYKDRSVYLSGPNAMVHAYSGMLRKAGVSRQKIKKDYFSGY